MCEVCGGDCKLCHPARTYLEENLHFVDSNGGEVIKKQDPLFTEIIDRIEDIGRARQKLKSILDTEVFDNLSKHNPYWESKDEEMSERLYEIRMSLSCLNDNLWDLWAILNKE